MNRAFYLALAARGLRMPIGTDLVMHEESEPENVRNDGGALARVIKRALLMPPVPDASARPVTIP